MVVLLGLQCRPYSVGTPVLAAMRKCAGRGTAEAPCLRGAHNLGACAQAPSPQTRTRARASWASSSWSCRHGSWSSCGSATPRRAAPRTRRPTGAACLAASCARSPRPRARPRTALRPPRRARRGGSPTPMRRARRSAARRRQGRLRTLRGLLERRQHRAVTGMPHAGWSALPRLPPS